MRFQPVGYCSSMFRIASNSPSTPWNKISETAKDTGGDQPWVNIITSPLGLSDDSPQRLSDLASKPHEVIVECSEAGIEVPTARLAP